MPDLGATLIVVALAQRGYGAVTLFGALVLGESLSTGVFAALVLILAGLAINQPAPKFSAPAGSGS